MRGFGGELAAGGDVCGHRVTADVPCGKLPRARTAPGHGVAMTSETVVSRRGLLDRGWGDHDIRRALRRRELFTAHRGVYVTHNGRLSWPERARAAVLSAWPAVLSGASALRADGLELPADPLLIAVDHARRPRHPAATVRRKRGVLERSRTHLVLPRERVEEAAIDVAEASDFLDAVAVLTAVCGARLTTASRLLDELDRRRSVTNRAMLRDVLLDASRGTHSVLEHGYVDRVERPHRLPSAARQSPFGADGSRGYHDLDYDRVVVELDGRQHASTFSRDQDRDLLTAARGRDTLRLGWRQVFDSPCVTADAVAAVLQRHGWGGYPARCGPRCVVGTWAASW